MTVKRMTWQERRKLKERQHLEALQKRKTKAFNKLLKDKTIRSIKKEDGGFYCITYKDGARFCARGFVVDNSLIFETHND